MMPLLLADVLGVDVMSWTNIVIVSLLAFLAFVHTEKLYAKHIMN